MLPLEQEINKLILIDDHALNLGGAGGDSKRPELREMS